MGGRRISVHPMQQLVVQPAPASDSVVAAEGQHWHLPATEIMRRRSINIDADVTAAAFGPSPIVAPRGLAESPDMSGGQDNFRMQRLEADVAELDAILKHCFMCNKPVAILTDATFWPPSHRLVR